MRFWVSLHVGPHDRPNVVLHPPDENDDHTEAITIQMADGASITGDRADVERWVRDLATQIAMQEA